MHAVNDLPGVVATGDRRASLEAIRDRLALALDDVDSRYVAPLAKQLTDTIRELDQLPAVKGSKVDEFTARAAAKRRAVSAS